MRNRVLLANAIEAARRSGDAAPGLKGPSTLEVCLHRSQIVLNAGYFDPSLLTPQRLIESKLVKAAEIRKSSRFEKQVCQLKTSRYRMTVLAPQMQVILGARHNRDGALAARKVRGITKLMPNAVLRSVSMNITWHLWPAAGDLNNLSRRMFGAKTNAIHTRFDGDDSFFGTYVSAPMFDGRLKVDVKPVEANSADGTELHLSFAFNFSCDLPSDRPRTTFKKHLGQWDEAFRITQKVMSDLRKQFGKRRKPRPR